MPLTFLFATLEHAHAHMHTHTLMHTNAHTRTHTRTHSRVNTDTRVLSFNEIVCASQNILGQWRLQQKTEELLFISWPQFKIITSNFYIMICNYWFSPNLGKKVGWVLFWSLKIFFFLTPTTPIALQRPGTCLTRPDPRPQMESTINWVPDWQVELYCTGHEFHNSVLALLSPFLGWVALIYL